jgi:hypothetical protein
VATSSGGTAAEWLDQARQSLFRHEFIEAERALEAALGSGPSAAEASEAHRRLAVLAWRFQLDPERGRRHLAAAAATGEQFSEAFAELARLELADHRLDAAWRAADRSLATAASARDSARAVDRLATVALRVARDGGWPGATEARRLERVQRELAAVRTANPASLPASLHLVQVALLLDDGPGALAAWRSYYEQALDRPGPLPAAHATLGDVLPRWSGPRTPRAERIAAIEALTASAMIDAAAILAADSRVDRELSVAEAPSVTDALAYADFLHALDLTAQEYHRRVAAGSGDPDRFREAVLAHARDLFHRLSWPEGPPTLEPTDSSAQRVWRELSERFGGEPNLGMTAGVYNLYYGHRVIDERRTVEQYGHRADVRFISLDGMVSNGYQTWAWDGAASNGGWQWRDVIVQIRPAYVGQGAAAWSRLHAEDAVAPGAGAGTETGTGTGTGTEAGAETGTGTEARAGTRAETGTGTGAETGMGTVASVAAGSGAGAEPEREFARCAYVPGLRERIEKLGLEQLRDSLRAEGLEGEALRAAFFAEFDRERVESSIFHHEGRHAIDRVLGVEGSEELEFRAKLSEVAFARHPRLALGGILSANAGDSTPHGQANARVLCGVVDWMESRAGQIQGFDGSRPVLPQLILLTDDQLRDAFRSLDPLSG